MGYAFISYSTENQTTGDQVYNLFKNNCIDTWMAPYDIPAGGKYAMAINQAIKGCSCFVLLLSNAAQNSTWVSKEVERAIHYGKPIVPVQLEPLELNDEFEFYISTDQIVALSDFTVNSMALDKIMTRIVALAGQDLQQETEKEPEQEINPEDLIVTLNDENGNEVKYQFLDLIKYKGTEYVVLLPVDDEEGQVVILEVQDMGNGLESYTTVDDETLVIIFDIFKEKFKDVFNFPD